MSKRSRTAEPIARTGRWGMLAFTILALIVPACSPGGWTTADGHRLPDTESRRSARGFSGLLVVTADTDWQRKMATPWDTVPTLNAATTVPRGQHLFVLTFFANPLLREGAADVTCDIDVRRPDGSTSVHEARAVCFRGPLKSDPRLVYLSAPVIEFVGEDRDPAGRWLVSVTLHDEVRRASLRLHTSFVLR